jgi:hypothetical protein
VVHFLGRCPVHGGGNFRIAGRQRLAVIEGLCRNFARMVDAHESAGLGAFCFFEYQFTPHGGDRAAICVSRRG